MRIRRPSFEKLASMPLNEEGDTFAQQILRRYPDLVCHRALLRELGKAVPGLGGKKHKLGRSRRTLHVGRRVGDDHMRIGAAKTQGAHAGIADGAIPRERKRGRADRKIQFGEGNIRVRLFEME